MDSTSEILWLAFRLLGSLALLIFGMKQMSDTLQKMAGSGLRHVLARMTTNRFTGMLTGILVTATVQSSTATTVMTVSFVNAGLLTLAQAISVIMGANIGTTLTAWIMSAGFSFNITDFVWPAFLVAMFLIYRKRHENVGDFLFGVAFMFLGLGTLRQTGVDMNLGENPAVLNFFSSFDPQSFTTTLLFLLIGGVLTMCVQSSAAVMAITMILCSSGALPIYQGIALVMGENIGTTVTSNLAALTASTQARRAAFAHMFFNLFGVCWMLVVFHPFVNFVCGLVGYDAQMTKEAVGQAAFLANAAKLSFVLAAFHTCFNLANTAILIWFIPQIEKIVCWVIKAQEADKETFRLKYIDMGLMQTPEIAVLQAQKEVKLFAERVHQMFDMVRQLLNEKESSKFTKLFSQIETQEDITDQMEIEIARYLEQVSEEHLSDETKMKIRLMMREISELESIGDACYNLARTMNRRQESGKDFTTKQYVNLQAIMHFVEEALTQMNRVVENREESDIRETYRIENEINAMRQTLKTENIQAINDHEYDYTVGTMYIDLVNECEKLGDYVVNVVQARLGK
ncbi:MAG: Na/Pi cotransporter family protein [Bacteroidaceae bacterium]|nr:Na/Pi cotransporter family protein [Bacteroidaceae bacterium]